MKVTVFCYRFLNDISDRRGYRKAVEFDLPDSERDHMVVLEHIFEQLNVGGELVPAEPWCEEYRAAGNPSLSVDDVVILGDKPWHCARFGWKPLDPSWEPGEDEYEYSFAKGSWSLKRPAPAA